jgi:hypothetical protein
LKLRDSQLEEHILPSASSLNPLHRNWISYHHSRPAEPLAVQLGAAEYALPNKIWDCNGSVAWERPRFTQLLREEIFNLLFAVFRHCRSSAILLHFLFSQSHRGSPSFDHSRPSVTFAAA